MSSGQDEVKVKFGAETGELDSGANHAKQVVQESVETIKKHFEGLGSTLEGLNGIFVKVAAVLAGGVMFKGAVDTTMKLSAEVTGLSKQLGISREEASTLRVAIDNALLTTDDYMHSVTMLNRQLRQNEEGLQRLGIATRDDTGQKLTQQQVLTNALNTMKEYKEGIDRNMYSMAVFGRGAADATKLLKLNEETMKGAASEARKLGVVMDQELADKIKKVKEGLNFVRDAGEALEVTVGRAVIPALAALAELIESNEAPILENLGAVLETVGNIIQTLISVISDLAEEVFAAFKSIYQAVMSVFGEDSDPTNGMGIFKSVLAAVNIVVLAAGAIFKNVFASISFVIQDAASAIQSFIEIARALIHLDLSGARKAWEDHFNRVAKLAEETNARMIKNTAEANEKIGNVLAGRPINGGPKAPEPYSPKGTRTYEGQDKPGQKEKPVKDMLSAEYALQKAMAESELALLKDKLSRSQALYDDAYSKNLINAQQYWDASLSITQTGLDKEIETRKKEADYIQSNINKSQAKGTPEAEKETLKFRAELVKVTTDLALLEAKRAEAAINANQKRIDAEQKLNASLKSIAIQATDDERTAILNADFATFQQRQQLGIINALQMTALERQMEDRLTEIKRAALQERLSLEKNTTRDPVAVAQLNSQLEQLELEHQLKIKGIQQKALAEQNKPLLNVVNTMEASMNSSINNLLTGTSTLVEELRKIFIQFGVLLIEELITKPAVARAAAWIRDKIMNVGEATSQAGVAGASAVASAASIPGYGWMIAPEAGAAAFSAAMGFAGVAASAEGGFDIPKGMNPKTQLHSEEMVLPEDIANPMREMVRNSSGSGNNKPFNLHINAVDAYGVKRLFENNGSALVGALRKQVRNFAS